MSLDSPTFSITNDNEYPYIYLNSNKPIEDRVEDALDRLSVEEKVAMCHAQSKFTSPGVPRLGIPEIKMSDGPHGIREELMWDSWESAHWTNDYCFAFPALTCLASTWNLELSLLYGKSIGEEARYRNKNVLLGPGVNIYRTPLNGRNFEYMGEDPYLTSKMVVPYIKGVQSNGVAACVKHFALNNQEVNRHKINIHVDNRTLQELYLPAFKAAVQEGNVWAIMGAYNKFNDEHCCHNEYLLKHILKEKWKFDGVVVSDWGGTHDTKEAINHGLDMEFGTWTDGLSWGESDSYARYYLADSYLELIQQGKVDQNELNDKVRRILRLIFRTTMNGKQQYGAFVSEEHKNVGRSIAEEGIVLLKNINHTLPLSPKGKNIVVIGENAVRSMTQGGGSSALKVKYEVSPLQGIQERIRKECQIEFALGYVSDSYKKQEKIQKNSKELREEAVALAKKADSVLFIGGLNKDEGQDCEGDDRKDMDLPYEQNRLIEELVKINKNVIVIILSGNAVSMPWVDKVPAILESWYCGSEAGHALASVIFGDTNPSGKLPFTFPVSLYDNAVHALGTYPGNENVLTYKEGLFIGYRWHDKQGIKPLFSFGHGLSYTIFKYNSINLDKDEMSADEKLTVFVSVSNIGERKGKEVVQLYIKDVQSSLPRPEKELKGFTKIDLSPGESKEITFTIDKEMLTFYDDQKEEWILESGTFQILIGASADDIRLQKEFKLTNSHE